MTGTAAILVCLISLHYLSVIDAYTAGFTSENGMPGREHEDKHPRKSTVVKRSLSKSMRQEPDYNWVDYGGIPNIPGYMDRDGYDLGIYGDIDVLPETSHRHAEGQRRSAGARRSLDEAKRQGDYYDTMRQGEYYYDDLTVTGGIPNIPVIYSNKEMRADEDKNSFSKTMQRLLSPVVDAVRQLWGKLSGKSLESVGGGDTKREDALRESVKKRAMKNRKSEDRELNGKNRIIGSSLNYLTDVAKKALDYAYNIINKIDVSHLTEETKKLKEAILEILRKAREAVEELLNRAVSGVESPSSRRTRSVRKRTNARDALDSYLKSLKSQKRSRARSSLRRSMRGNTSARASDMTAVMDLMAEMEECIRQIPPTNTSQLGVKCIVLPLIKVLSSPKLGSAKGLTTDSDYVRSDEINSPDSLRRLNFPWSSIFLIPVYTGPIPSLNHTEPPYAPAGFYNGQRPRGNHTEPPYDHAGFYNGQRPRRNHTEPPYDHAGFDNETTTTTTTTTTTSTTTMLPTPDFDVPDRSVRSDSKYRSRFDNDY